MSKNNLAAVMSSSSKKPSRQSITIDSWDGVLFLVREPDRHGNATLFIRLVFGDMPSKRYGPFPTLKKATACFKEMIEKHLEPELWDLSNEMGIASRNYGACGLYGMEH